MKVNIVYHCFLTGNWENVVLNQIMRLKTSGLYEFANRIIITVNLNEQPEDKIKQLLIDFPKLEFLFSPENHAEYLGIKTVREIATSEECYILYFHSKGVSNVFNNFNDKTISQEKIENINSWKECLEYFLIDKWKESIGLLSYYDNVGVTCNRGWYWGNFWWSQSQHIKKTIPVEIWGRWDYEAWLNRNVNDVKNFEWYHFDYNPYLTFIHEDWYQNKDKKTVVEKLHLKNAFYGTPKFQIDEGYSNSNLNLGNDVTDIVNNLLSSKNFDGFDFLVENGILGGDPFFGTKKFLFLEFCPISNPDKTYKIGVDEGQYLNFNLFSDNETSNYQITKIETPKIEHENQLLSHDVVSSTIPKILILVITCKSYNHRDQVTIDRTDLTRQLDCKNTWVEDATNYGIDVVFFEGGGDVVSYNENTITLSLDVDDRYEDQVEPSRIFEKIKKAFEWVLENKEFDIVYVMDDDIFVNVPEFLKIDFNYDFISNGVLGGSGGFFSKKGMRHCLKQTNETFSQADHAVHNLMRTDDTLRINHDLKTNCPQYFPGELYSTVHYVTGKRMYFLHNMLRNFRENGVTNRKILLYFPLNTSETNNIITYEVSVGRKTKRWYDFTTDLNGWEYHGGYTRSDIDLPNLKRFWPYSKKSTKYFVVNYDYVKHDMNFIVSQCQDSLIDPNNLYFFTEKEEVINGWQINTNLKQELKLTFEGLNNYFFYSKVI